MVNSRAKGAAGEREFRDWLKTHFQCEARRGQQFCGSQGSPDVVHNIDGLHFEVKRTERLSIYDAVDQACGDCGDSVPIVAHRRNRGDWLFVIKAKDATRFAQALLAFKPTPLEIT